ncbi:unnamed protein product [marine sediment metagenome]|uniref:Uncharacterized protein n=1 Tax=marine sediment metagenome TaxID=412755 RepID=X0W2U8_9ZZZZ
MGAMIKAIRSIMMGSEMGKIVLKTKNGTVQSIRANRPTEVLHINEIMGVERFYLYECGWAKRNFGIREITLEKALTFLN